MKYRFKQALHLGGKDFHPGVHTVPEKMKHGKVDVHHCEHPHFLKYVAAGFIVESEVTEAVSLTSHKERTEMLLNKLIGQKKPKVKAKSHCEPCPPPCPEPEPTPCEPCEPCEVETKVTVTEVKTEVTEVVVVEEACEEPTEKKGKKKEKK